MRKPSGVVTSSTVVSTDPFQSGSQWASQRNSTGNPRPMPKKSGVTQRTRSQPGAVRRRMPLGGGAGRWSCSICAGAAEVVMSLRVLRQILHELVQLVRRDLRAEDRRHHVLVAGLDVGAGIHDRLLDEGGKGAAIRLRRVLLELVEIGTCGAGRACRLERVAPAAPVLLENRQPRRS